MLLTIGEQIRFSAEGEVLTGTVERRFTLAGTQFVTVLAPGGRWQMTVGGENAERLDCRAARTGEGYWTCDVPGGCGDCRTLAREINDTDQITEWNEEEG